MLVRDTALLTLGCGFMLCVVAGAFFDGSTRARGSAIVAFVFVSGLCVPAMLRHDPIIITEVIGMAVSTLYLMLCEPIERIPRTNFDEADSASQFGL